VELKAEGMKKVRARFARMARVLDDPGPVLRDFGHQVVASVVDGFQRVARGEQSAPGLPPANRSGLLRQSVTFEVKGATAVEIGTNLIYGAIQHFGGVVKPVRARALAIPLNAAARRRGPREWPDGTLFLVPDDDDPDRVGILFRAKGAEDLEPMYVLRAKVTLPARPWLKIYPQDVEYFLARIEEEMAA